MRRMILMTLTAVVLAGCQESLEERCEREAREYTEKHCPTNIGPNSVIDSLTFERESHTLHYWYTMTGTADDSLTIQRTNPRQTLLTAVKNTPAMKIYMDAGYNFAYTYYSSKQPGRKLYETVIKEKDYR